MPPATTNARIGFEPPGMPPKRTKTVVAPTASRSSTSSSARGWWGVTVAAMARLRPKKTEKPKREKPTAEPLIRTARELGGREFSVIRYVVPGYVVEGLTALRWQPKIGK